MKKVVFLLILLVLIAGCVETKKGIKNIVPSKHVESPADVGNYCDYSKDYQPNEKCFCKGNWVVYNKPSLEMTTDKIYVCRKIKDNYHSGVIVVGFYTGTKFEEADKIIRSLGGVPRTYTPDWKNYPYPEIVIDVNEGEESMIIGQLNLEKKVKYAKLEYVSVEGINF